MKQIQKEINESINKLKIVQLRNRGISRIKIAQNLGITIKKVRYWEQKFEMKGYQKKVISRCRVFTDMDKEFGKWNWILMQDGAPAHTSRSTKEYLSKKCSVLENWPPNSPDLNPIENLWGIMGKKN
ncbi:transposable element-related [Anaeramoeba flamelloides]|uniref:Transposable element-related n=1 Tax=Anaeramoeba flamelloides TaxID=1746091 RepID=A0AAV7ZP24_9EUKA|nr:transposable element-related [Anaeramoeba flamelloides]